MYGDNHERTYKLRTIRYKNYENGDGDFDFTSDKFTRIANCAQ
jgi:hypothetical protein